MNYFKYVFTGLCLSLMACSNDDDAATVNLESSGILGVWEIQSRATNGVTPAIIFCCEFISFTDDANTADRSGNFQTTSGFDSTMGTFRLSENLETIHFEYDDATRTYDLELDSAANRLIFDFTDSENNTIEERWLQIDTD